MQQMESGNMKMMMHKIQANNTMKKEIKAFPNSFIVSNDNVPIQHQRRLISILTDIQRSHPYKY
jgi:hypothetical protein